VVIDFFLFFFPLSPDFETKWKDEILFFFSTTNSPFPCPKKKELFFLFFSFSPRCRWGREPFFSLVVFSSPVLEEGEEGRGSSLLKDPFFFFLLRPVKDGAFFSPLL